MTVLLVILGFIAFLALAIWGSIHTGNLSQKMIESAKNDYDTALNLLQKNPDDPEAHKNALDLGRKFYQQIIPDKELRQGHRVISTTDNSANRETKIANDIQARMQSKKSA